MNQVSVLHVTGSSQINRAPRLTGRKAICWKKEKQRFSFGLTRVTRTQSDLKAGGRVG